MESFKEIIEQEEARIKHILDEIHATLAEEEKDRHQLEAEISAFKRQKLESNSWREKQEIDEQIACCRDRYGMRFYQDSRILRAPYFGVLELEDDDLGSLSYCLGPRSFFDRSSRVLIIDWRESPISRLYYEYDAGEDYGEIIQGRDRSGLVRCKRQVDTSGGKLRRILLKTGAEKKGELLICGDNGEWKKAADSGNSISRKEAASDHRLPEITALISREQFQTITQPEAGTVLLRGGAGSGKTTVGLHRIAYLTYQNPERFRPDRILVVMFNRSLQRYISRTLPDLGVKKGVFAETYHSWAARLFRAVKMPISYTAESPPPDVIRFKKHAVMLSLTDVYLKNLLKKSRDWFLEQLKENHEPEFQKISSISKGFRQFDDFFQFLASHPLFAESSAQDFRNQLRLRLLRRFEDHESDFHALFSEEYLSEEILSKFGFRERRNVIEQVLTWQANLREKKQRDFSDTAILLWLMQRKGLSAVRPDYAHIMVDEAQDLSEVELATLLYAADKEQSVTICGDMAQKIKGDVSFGNPEGFVGFIKELQTGMGNKNVCAYMLTVGYRATRQIMELAWKVLGKKPDMATPREGEAVEIIRTQTILKAYLESRPSALVGVVCRYKADADRVFEDLKHLGIETLRRHERDDFSFAPGAIVTNAHQVKGLEFSAVMVVNPAVYQYRDTAEDRMLLHVVMTRAADRLWLVGHQTMAYGLEEWE